MVTGFYLDSNSVYVISKEFITFRFLTAYCNAANRLNNNLLWFIALISVMENCFLVSLGILNQSSTSAMLHNLTGTSQVFFN